MNKYNMNAKSELVGFLAENGGRHMTVKDIFDHFSNEGRPLSQTTIYRKMEELVSEGIVKKYMIDNSSSACFEYVGPERSEGSSFYHMKCSECGRLIHFQCEEMDEFARHMTAEHELDVDLKRTVFFGKCGECGKKR